jgi:hypothetical protein
VRVELLATGLPPKTAAFILDLAHRHGTVERGFAEPEAPFPNGTAAAPIGDEDVQGSGAYSGNEGGRPR